MSLSRDAGSAAANNEAPASASAPRTAPARPTEQQMLKASEKYTLLRHCEYCQYGDSIRPLHPRDIRPYRTELKQCPCGSQLPCPWHEPLPDIFWGLRPIDDLYGQILSERNSPFRFPSELCA